MWGRRERQGVIGWRQHWAHLNVGTKLDTCWSGGCSRIWVSQQKLWKKTPVAKEPAARILKLRMASAVPAPWRRAALGWVATCCQAPGESGEVWCQAACDPALSQVRGTGGSRVAEDGSSFFSTHLLSHHETHCSRIPFSCGCQSSSSFLHSFFTHLSIYSGKFLISSWECAQKAYSPRSPVQNRDQDAQASRCPSPWRGKQRLACTAGSGETGRGGLWPRSHTQILAWREDPSSTGWPFPFCTGLVDLPKLRKWDSLCLSGPGTSRGETGAVDGDQSAWPAQGTWRGLNSAWKYMPWVKGREAPL